jgi:N-acetylmuramoyl-L-alanine amidase
LVAPERDGSYPLRLETNGASVALGTVVVAAGTKTFRAAEAVVTRQGPDSDYERLTPLVAGAQVEVNGQRGDWYRSTATGAWLDGRSGAVEPGWTATPRLTRIAVDALANGDAQLTLSCGTIPEAVATMSGNGLLSLTLAATEDQIFDVTKEASAANFLGAITVRPQTPVGTVVEVALGPEGIGGYQLDPGNRPGDLVLRVRRPVPKSLKGLIITLDAGHGGPKDPGTVGHGGLPEKVLNLRVTQSLARMLRERGATVIMTRTTDADVATDEKGASHELQARIDLSVAQRAHLFLSLHHNARPSVEEGKISHGTDIYWYQPVSEPLARALAGPIADAIEEPLRTSRFRSFHVIRQTFSPSVLIEFQYLSNPTLEAQVLDRPDYADRAAGGVVKGLEAYLRALP